MTDERLAKLSDVDMDVSTLYQIQSMDTLRQTGHKIENGIPFIQRKLFMVRAGLSKLPLWCTRMLHNSELAENVHLQLSQKKTAASMHDKVLRQIKLNHNTAFKDCH